jgi:hypothetical protein
MVTNISEEHTAFVFRVEVHWLYFEEEGSRFLQLPA